MKINWQVTNRDVEKLKRFVAQYRDNPFVLRRKNRNIDNPPKRVSRGSFWHAMVTCMLTTQQRSGPDSPVSRFSRERPFPLAHKRCLDVPNLQSLILEALTSYGGIRMTDTIAKQLDHNLARLEGGLWPEVFRVLRELKKSRTARAERVAAAFIADTFKGFGPKQSRNLLQFLGLTRWEVLIDSRTTKWLRWFGFPLNPPSGSLSNPEYYNLIVDGLQVLCRKAHIYPCILDAAIFTSFD